MGARCVHVAYPHRALANNCHASYDKEGAEPVDWKKGKPVLVVCPHISKTKTHAHKHTHTSSSFLYMPCPLTTLGRIQKRMLVHSVRFKFGI